jgi:hypothetical protein
MEIEKYWGNCIRFSSAEMPCPNKDNEYLFKVKHWVAIKPEKPHTLRGDEIEKAKTICFECIDFLCSENLRK